jgi:hypothetical protein
MNSGVDNFIRKIDMAQEIPMKKAPIPHRMSAP